jgi:hypothetical protein
MPQTTYALDSNPGLPGMVQDGSDVQEVVSYPAAEAIPFGRMLELDSGGTKVQLAQGTGQQIAKPVGVSVYDATKMPGDATLAGLGYSSGYSVGDLVKVLRKGRIYAEFSGTTDAALATANVYHSSTIATNRGKFTDVAGAAGAGVEVADAVGSKFVKPVNATVAGLCIVEINLP